MIITAIPISASAANTGEMITVADLKAKYPNGKYWNGKNAETYTSTPCNHHGRCSFSGSCGCNTFKGQAIQCMGFAYQLGYLVFGGNPYRDWRKNYSVSALNTLKPGDVIRLNHNRHSIFVTAVNGEIVTYADCNSDGHCIIRWDKKITKSKIRASFSYVAVAPAKWTGASHTHNYKKQVTKATLTKNGKVVEKCTGCQKVKSQSTIYKVASIKLSATSHSYNGKQKTPTVTVKDVEGNILKKDKDYTVTYSSGRKTVGTYKVTVKMKGNYSGTKTLTFKIIPRAASVNKLTANKKEITVKLNRSLQQSSGYQIQYSTKKDFAKYETKTISNYQTSFATIKNLKSKKTYYVRVRTYKTVGNKKYYSNWSTVKSVKTK